MPTSITFTANAGTDQLTATAHGLLTGDRFRTRNTDGALPAPLAAVTTYFAIRIDTNTLKVATSSANALAGTAVNITDAGTGTHTLEYGLPYCEPRVAAAGTQIKSEDDNATWASLTALHALLTGQSETVWGGSMKLAGDLEPANIINTPALPQGAAFNGGPLAITGIINATLALGDNDDLNPGGLLSSSIILRLTGNAGGSNLTGLVGGTGQVITIFNVGSPDITVVHEDAGSTAANRIVLPNATASVVIRDGGSMTLWYDPSSTRWRVLAQYL